MYFNAINIYVCVFYDALYLNGSTIDDALECLYIQF